MNALQQFVARRPLAFAVLLSLPAFVVNLVDRLVFWMRPDLEWNLGLMTIGEAAVSLLAIVLLMSLGWWREAGFNGPKHWRALHVLWLPALIAALPALNLINPEWNGVLHSTGTIALMAIGTFLIGFEEEARFRGLMLRALLPAGQLRAFLLASLLFGLSHIGNLVVGKHPLFVLAQLIMTIGSGLCFTAIRLRIGTIWPLIIVHALNDFLPMVFNPEVILSGAAPSIGFVIFAVSLGVLFGGYGLFLMRHELRARRVAPAAPQAAS